MTRRLNDYARAYGSLYAATPKTVFAALLFDALVQLEGQDVAGWPKAQQQLLISRWRALHIAGIVAQRPPA